MLNKSLTRAFRFVVAASIAVLPALTQPAGAAAAASTGTLYGLGPRSITTIDPATGASSTFVNLPSVDVFPGASFNMLVADPAGHRLFTQRTLYVQQDDGSLAATYQLVTVDTADATAAPTVSRDMPSGITDLVFDPSSQSLFGQTNMCCPFQLVRIDPATGAQTHVSDIPGVQPLKMTIAPAKHSIYMPIEDFNQFTPVNTIATFDTSTGAVSQSRPMATGIFALEYDSSTGALYGKTFCCPGSIVKVNPATGAERLVTANLGLGSGIAIDSASHTIYMTDDEQGAYSFNQFIQAVDLQAGTLSTSLGALPADTYVGSLAFVGVATTPDAILQDVQTAQAAGEIGNAGVATSLINELTQANAARGRGDCTTAGNIYRAFVNDVNAQAGKAITASTAAQLVAEAQALIATCP